MVQRACARMALPQPGTIFNATDPQTQQLGEFINEMLVEYVKWPDTYWVPLLRETTFTTLAADAQPVNAVPSDLDHFVDNSMWDRTLTRPVVGPISPQIWEAWKARPVLTSVVFGFTIRGYQMFTAPNPPAGDLVAYQYVTNQAVYPLGASTDGSGNPVLSTQQYFENDTDTCVFDTEILVKGVRWCFLRAKGLSYEQEYQQWIEAVQMEASRSGGMPRISMAGSYNDWLVGPYVPQFNFPGNLV
jgi:hypothetical protein